MKRALVIILVLIVAAFAWAWSGAYDPGADARHWKITEALLGFVREQGIDRRADAIEIPADLSSHALLAQGAGHYKAMCAGCHLAPGGPRNSDLRRGLYPQPPDLTKEEVEPAEAFWIIKHGLKMTAMPAWGATHSDDEIWALVALVTQLPKMDAAQYAALAAEAPTHNHDDEHGARHDRHDGEHGQESAGRDQEPSRAAASAAE